MSGFIVKSNQKVGKLGESEGGGQVGGRGIAGECQRWCGEKITSFGQIFMYQMPFVNWYD